MSTQQRIKSIQQETLKLLDFAHVSRLPNLEQRREQMLGRLQEIYGIAESRTRLGKHGDIVDPDCHAMIKAIELSCSLMGMQGEVERKLKQQQDPVNADVEYVASMLRSCGYSVEKAA